MIYDLDDPNGKQYSFEPYKDTIRDHLHNTEVDLSWLGEYDLDMIDGIQAFFELNVFRHEISDKDSPLQTTEEALAYAEGVGESIAKVCDAIRRMPSEKEPFFVILQILVGMAYERGVADAHTGKIGPEAAAELAQRQAKADDKRKAMREFYDDIRQE